MTTQDLARWFAATRKVRPLVAVRLAEQVVIRHSLRPEKPASQLTLPFFPISRAGPAVKR